jgi:hypothetical protein
MNKIISLCLGLFIVFVVSCTKETTVENDNTSSLSKIPVVENFVIQPNVVKALEDSLSFLISYADGNGDLGFAHPDSASLYIEDRRNGIVERFHIGAITNEGFSNPIRGTLILKIPFVILNNTQNQTETAVFSARISDREGNISLPKESNTITVNP